MKASNRDLLVLVKNEFPNDRFMEQEIEQLHELLYRHETLQIFCRCHEIFDLNKFKILRKRSSMQRVISQEELKPFQFLCNKN